MHSLRLASTLKRLREESPKLEVNEAWLQRVWFEGFVQKHLRCLKGQSLEIIHCGFWNRSAGPDFLNAKFLLPDGNTLCGDVELHVELRGWNAHQHDLDPAYSNVVLHLFWQDSTQARQLYNAHGVFPLQANLRSNLAFSENELVRILGIAPPNSVIRSHAGTCSQTITQWSKDEQLAFLREVGMMRVAQRRRLFFMRRELLGEEQALWVSFAESLGYPDNKVAFVELASRVPLKALLSTNEELQREALLYGHAGWIKHEPFPCGDPNVKKYLHELWKRWWKIRDVQAGVPIWNLQGIRPINRPERRVGVLVLLSQKSVWKKFYKLCQQQNWDEIEHLLANFEHPFWNYRATLTSKPVQKIMPLLGKIKTENMICNVLIPYFSQSLSAMHEQLQLRNHCESNRRLVLARTRITAGTLTSKEMKSYLIQQGLLELLQNYCVPEFGDCSTCKLPQFLTTGSTDSA